jgi:Protein of unknown function (DUF1579)
MLRVLVAGLVLLGVMANVVNGQESYAAPEPSPEHALLKNDVGVWDAAMTIFTPGQEPMKGKGVETGKMIGGFWVFSHLEYEMMGMKFSGVGSYGYDPDAKKYVGSWLGSDGPHASHMVGDYDAETKTFTYEMSFKDATGNPAKGKIIFNYPDANRRHFELHMDMGGEMAKFLEIEYTKRK